MFDCPTCQLSCRKLIASPIKEGRLRCENCFDSSPYRPSYLHEKMNDTANSITRSKWDIIGNRTISPDDHKTVIDRRTGRETQY